jgi:hypothetical protein
MQTQDILFPMIALVALTFVVLLHIPFRRFRAGARGEVAIDDFKLGESANVPGKVSLPNRNLMNLLETPILFYVACLTLYVTGKVDMAALVLAWIYVALRVIHSAIHLTYNKVFHRLAAFALSNVVLLVLWVRLTRALL